jgi:hypothetical protein
LKIATFKMSAKTHQNFKVLQFQRKLIFYLEDFRPEECDSDKYDFKMVAIAAIMVAIFNMVPKTTIIFEFCPISNLS